MKITELEPANGQKSFYGKAKVLEFEDGWKFLKSYSTIVAGIGPNGGLHRYTDIRTNTTSKHIVAFLKPYFGVAMTPKEFYGIESDGIPSQHCDIDDEQ